MRKVSLGLAFLGLFAMCLKKKVKILGERGGIMKKMLYICSEIKIKSYDIGIYDSRGGFRFYC